MARGPKKHLKRMAAPSHWMLDKLTGHYAPRPSTGPHKLRECLPLVILLRNRLKYALTYNEVKLIVMQRLIKVDGKVRTDTCYPSGFMDVVSIEKTKENFRILLDCKGRFVPHLISDEEAKYKLCKVKKICLSKKGVPMAITMDGRTIRYVHPSIGSQDTIRFDLEKNEVLDWIKFEVGACAMITGGHNVGRVGQIVHTEKHLGGFDIVHMRDNAGKEFSTRSKNIFLIGKDSKKPWISLPKDRGVKKTIQEERMRKLRQM